MNLQPFFDQKMNANMAYKVPIENSQCSREQAVSCPGCYYPMIHPSNLPYSYTLMNHQQFQVPPLFIQNQFQDPRACQDFSYMNAVNQNNTGVIFNTQSVYDPIMIWLDEAYDSKDQEVRIALVNKLRNLSGEGSTILDPIIDGDLDLTGWSDLKSLPENLFIKGNLILNGCMSLHFLPSILHVRGDIIFSETV